MLVWQILIQKPEAKKKKRKKNEELVIY